MEVENKTLFGKYQIGRLLGKGTFGRVNHGKEIATGESVAIKVINKSKVKKEGMVDQIQREISVMHLVRHPNIVDLREVLATKTKIFFVMEYARGGELFAKVVKGKLSEELARKYFQQLISAVDFCHSRGVSHRDLKPENLLLDENENLKVSDFGLSALPEQLWNDGLLHTQCGTPSYVAPEILRRKGYDGSKADIWSCGIILYALLAGYLPFQHENLMYLYTKLLKAEFEFPPWFSLESRTLISNILVPDPHTRIPISSIMSAPWFLDGFSSSTCSSPHHQPWENKLASSRVHHPLSSSSPKFFNAFEFISTMSSGFDLSGLFEDKRRTSSIFTSKCSPSAILSKIDSMAKDLRFKIEKGKDSQVRLQAPAEGRSRRLLVAAEVFEVAEEVAVVEFSKCSGDTLEYEKLWEEQIRPALKDIVWTWQGEYCEEFSKSS